MAPDIYQLDIVDAQPEDRGIYQCQAVNSNGTTRYSAELLVRTALPPEILERLECLSL